MKPIQAILVVSVFVSCGWLVVTDTKGLILAVPTVLMVALVFGPWSKANG
jgi:hypothetical protein